ncbi:hypothetical protein DL240_07490 [Lujinxingia litoralis]|uniref:Serine/threonine protein kinase n=2 Tax=Lujinxingia litoralis TaxID=2211119 RepID=A0A328CAF9_9DELT|nr:hypothetical protein DL240_07490 [Lujinxingia litoralis]
MRRLLHAALLATALSTVACADFHITTPDQMVEVSKTKDTAADYVAMTHNGVVMRAQTFEVGESRSADAPPASLAFWEQAVMERMRTRGGYALLSTSEVQAASGEEGLRFEFGRDQNGAPYRYTLALFVTEKRIHLIEAGGRQDRYEEASAAIDDALASYQIKR